MILFISIVSNNQKIVKRLRRKSAKIVTNARTFKTSFKKIIIKELYISKFINSYNYYINKINNAN